MDSEVTPMSGNVDMEWTLKEDCYTLDNFLSREECQSLIKYFHDMKNAGLAESVNHLMRRDDQLYLHKESIVAHGYHGLGELTNKLIKVGLESYVSHYPTLADWLGLGQAGSDQRGGHNYDFSDYEFAPFNWGMYYAKLQRTAPSGGFHGWHYERGSLLTGNRFLTWSIYLNTIKEGGETEFLYKKLRVPAVEGRLSIFPVGFAHTHRGNPPLNEDKYILTGWFDFIK
jgi:hypothetical protein